MMAYPLPRALILCAAAASIAAGQKTDTTKKEKYVSSRFWESSTPFELTLSTNLKQINNDTGDPGPWRAAGRLIINSY